MQQLFWCNTAKQLLHQIVTGAITRPQFGFLHPQSLHRSNSAVVRLWYEDWCRSSKKGWSFLSSLVEIRLTSGGKVGLGFKGWERKCHWSSWEGHLIVRYSGQSTTTRCFTQERAILEHLSSKWSTYDTSQTTSDTPWPTLTSNSRTSFSSHQITLS